MNIKQVTVTSHPPGTSKLYKKSEACFDRSGNKTSFKEFKGGKIIIWEEFIYDSNNRLVELIKYEGDSFKVDDYKPISTKYQYNIDGNLLTAENWIEEQAPDGTRTLSSFYLNRTIKCRKYIDQNRKCFEEKHYKKESIIKSIMYNEKGSILEVKNFKADGQPLNFTVNVYNENNQLIKARSISRTGNVSEDRILKYNEKGLLVEDIDHPADPENACADVPDASNGYSRKYFYDAAGRLEKENLYLCGELVMAYVYNYTFW